MNEDKNIKEKAAKAIVSEAEAVAKNLVDTASRTAARMRDNDDENRMTKALSSALREVFGENEKSGRFIDVSRIPLICQSITGIHEEMKEQKEIMRNLISQDQFWPVKTIVYSGVGIVLMTVAGAILMLVINK